MDIIKQREEIYNKTERRDLGGKLEEQKNASKKESTRLEDMFEQTQYTRTQIGGERQRSYENSVKESINKYMQLINNLSSLSDIQLVKFLNILSNDPEMFNRLKEVTEWESKILSEFMKDCSKI